MNIAVESASSGMQLEGPADSPVEDELELMRQWLQPAGKQILELGCGAAQATRRMMQELSPARITATEVDPIQHEKNSAIKDLPGVEFVFAGAEAIPLADASVDCVVLLKSLHHVPLDQLDRALGEIARVLRPGGLAWISEPIYAGDFNAILRMFHDEEAVRLAAFKATGRAVDAGLLQLEQELFFRSLSVFQGFAEFEQRILGATHTTHQLSPELFNQVRAAFEVHVREGVAEFLMPMRVDLLRKS